MFILTLQKTKLIDEVIGKVLNTNSPTFRKYHQILWSKVLPTGNLFEIDLSIPKYLHHESNLGAFTLN